MSKVAVLGCGKVGMTAAYALLIKGVAHELVLWGRTKDNLIGEQLDLEHGLSFLGTTTVTATDSYADLAGSDVVVITAGAAQKPGFNRLDLIDTNKKIIEEMIPQVVHYAPNAVILMVTNPVDALTYHAHQISGLPLGRVIGTGTTLDTARFRFHLSEFLSVNPRSIHAYVLGEHGDSSFPVLSSATVGGQPLSTFPGFTEAKAQEAYTAARDAARRIIDSKGSTFYAIGVVVAQIVKTILDDAKTVLPVSVPLQDYYGHSDVALSIPCIIGKAGAREQLKLVLSPAEQAALAHTVEVLKPYC